jgi:glycosyltransferase involved in cell wall biosynthesis
MIIGIDASHAYLKEKTGIEEYAFNLIENFKKIGSKHSFILYLRNNPPLNQKFPPNFKIKILPWPLFWTQARLSWHFLKKSNRPDVFFSPSYTLPLICPSKSVVTIHGLEYLKTRKSYSTWHNFYHRLTTHLSIKKATSLISVSENTKKDLIEYYQINPEKIKVVLNGFTRFALENLTLKDLSLPNFDPNSPYFLFVGRIETRKNVLNIVKAFNFFKKNHPQYKLILAGSPGTVGYDQIKIEIKNSPFKKDILETGYVKDQDKFLLLKHAAAFIFPSFYEGFGLPVLEALQYNTPVILSRISSLPEVGGKVALYVNPHNPKEIYENLLKVESLRKDPLFSKKAQEQISQFSWTKCAQQTLKILTQLK